MKFGISSQIKSVAKRWNKKIEEKLNKNRVKTQLFGFMKWCLSQMKTSFLWTWCFRKTLEPPFEGGFHFARKFSRFVCVPVIKLFWKPH